MIKMAATLSLLMNIAMPTITQCVMSSAQFIVSLVIDVVLSLVYQGITVLGCGGVGVGGGVLGGVTCGGIMTVVVGWIMSGVAAIAGIIMTIVGGAGGLVTGVGGYGIADAIVAIVSAILHAASALQGLCHIPW